MTYNPGQLSVIFPFVENPEWLILGGPGDGDEAETAVKRWPNLRVMGFEPTPCLYEKHKRTFPGALFNWALSDRHGPQLFKYNEKNPQTSSLMLDRLGECRPVTCVTIDSAIHPYADRCIIWLDIEGHELEALRGAANLFARKRVLLVNVEVLERRTEATKQLENFFDAVGFKLARTWNEQPGLCQDRIYVLEALCR